MNSKTIVVLLCLSLAVITSGCTDVDHDPDEMAESYVYNLQAEDFEAAYGHLSDDVQSDVGFAEFEEDMKNSIRESERSGISHEVEGSRVIEKLNGTAIVEITMKRDLQGTVVSQSTELELEETDIGSWDLKSPWNPFEVETRDEEDIMEELGPIKPRN